MINKNFNDNLNKILGFYFNKKLSLKQISLKLGIPTTTLHRNLMKYGIKLRSFPEGVRLFHSQNPGIWKGQKRPWISEALKGHTTSKKTKKKIRKSLKKAWKNKKIRDKFISSFLRYYKTHFNHRKGKKNSLETRKKLSKTLKGRKTWNKGVPRSEETKRKISKKKKELIKKFPEKFRAISSKAGKIGVPRLLKL